MRVLREELGQATVEYGMLLAIVAAAGALLIMMWGIQAFFTQAEKQIQCTSCVTKSQPLP